MDMIRFGRSGLTVSRLVMGTMTFGEQADEEESVRMVNCALDRGVNFFDTADAYVKGRSEEILGKALGKALGGKRDRVVVASKVFNPMGPAPTDRGLSRKHIMDAVEASLRRLGMDYLDIYHLHQPDYDTPLEQSLEAMDQLVRDGKVRYVGLSNYAAWQTCRALWICDDRKLAPVVSMQPMYNLVSRGIERELLACCREFDLGVMVYNPLAGGLLTGKHAKGKPPAKGTRFGLKEMYRGRYWHDRLFDAVGTLSRIASDAGLSLVELSLRWLLDQDAVHCVILGASSMKQLEENFSAAEGGLPEGVASACDRVWESLRGPIPKYNR